MRQALTAALLMLAGPTQAQAAGEIFMDHLFAYCMKVDQVSHVYGFNKEILSSMKKSPYNVDLYWVTAGCRPHRIGGTTSPLIHWMIEDASGRLQFLKALEKYYLFERKEPALWRAVINAKNSRGQTLLDYAQYLKQARDLRTEEFGDVAEMVTYICANGAVNAVYQATCTNFGGPYDRQ
jgi:hypothetical protein